MHANPASLDSATLTACLRAAAGDERDRQVDFLRYLDAFDARDAYREAGFGSLWEYCLRQRYTIELHGCRSRRTGSGRRHRPAPSLVSSRLGPLACGLACIPG